MALQYSYLADFGVNFPEAYAVIESASWTKSTAQIQSHVVVYATKELHDSGAAPLFACDIAAPADVSGLQSYIERHISQRPEFAGSKVIEDVVKV